MSEEKLLCTCCNTRKMPNEFHLNRYLKRGRTNWCKKCRQKVYQQRKVDWGVPRPIGRTEPRVVSPKSKSHKMAAEIGVKLLRYKGTHNKGEFQCLKCNAKFVCCIDYFLKTTRRCPACSREGRVKKYHPDHMARKLLEMGVILDEKTYRGTKSLALLKCAKCGREWEMQPRRILKGGRSAMCACQKRPYSKRKTAQEAVEELRALGLEVVDPTTFCAKWKMEVRCLKCGSQWMDRIDCIRVRKHKCIADCCPDGSIRKGWKTTSVKAKKRDDGDALTPQEEDARIDAAIAEMDDDGLYFYERPELAEKIENGEIDILENVLAVIREANL